MMFRSLAFKLTLAFLFVSLVGAVLSAIFIQTRTRTEFDRFLFDQGKTDLVDALTQHYRNTGNWENIGTLLAQSQAFRSALDGSSDANRQGDHPWSPIRRLPYLLVDTQGFVIYGDADRIGQNVEIKPQDAVRLEVNGQTVGYLLTARFAPPVGIVSPERTFLASINRLILISALFSVLIALLLGGVLARTLTTSLRELTKATQVVASGQLGYQVAVRSQDEVGDLAASFNQMSADLAQSNQLRRQMTADVAHDLRTPLSVILGYTEALSDGKLQGSPEVFDVMHQEAAHLQHLIDDLRTLSLADAGELSLNLQSVAPETLINRTASALKPQAEQKGVRLEVSAEPDLPLIKVDPERLAQVLGNLVSNSLRYTPAGGLVALTARREAEQIILQVRDTGSGIAPDDLPYVFTRFYRGNKSRTANGEAGLGLSIAKSLVEANGGSITVDSALAPGSALQQGSAFSLHFPISG